MNEHILPILLCAGNATLSSFVLGISYEDNSYLRKISKSEVPQDCLNLYQMIYCRHVDIVALSW